MLTAISWREFVHLIHISRPSIHPAALSLHCPTFYTSLLCVGSGEEAQAHGKIFKTHKHEMFPAGFIYLLFLW